MAMLDIEYRYSGAPVPAEGHRRGSAEEMERYIRQLVYEMQAAGIGVRFFTGYAAEGEPNMVYINGRSVHEILHGLKIVIPEPEDICGSCSMGEDRPRLVRFGRPELDWDRGCVEDIPDILMKNAISKVYCDLDSDSPVRMNVL